jgi:transposase
MDKAGVSHLLLLKMWIAHLSSQDRARMKLPLSWKWSNIRQISLCFKEFSSVLSQVRDWWTAQRMKRRWAAHSSRRVTPWIGLDRRQRWLLKCIQISDSMQHFQQRIEVNNSGLSFLPLLRVLLFAFKAAVKWEEVGTVIEADWSM